MSTFQQGMMIAPKANGVRVRIQKVVNQRGLGNVGQAVTQSLEEARAEAQRFMSTSGPELSVNETLRVRVSILVEVG